MLFRSPAQRVFTCHTRRYASRCSVTLAQKRFAKRAYLCLFLLDGGSVSGGQVAGRQRTLELSGVSHDERLFWCCH